MPKARKNTRKAPITRGGGEGATPAGSSSNPAATRAVIRHFHVLLKRKAQLEKGPGDARTAQALADVEHEIESLGGLKAYQRMSTIGQGNDRGGGSEKIFVGWLQDIGIAGSAQAEKKRLRCVLYYSVASTQNLFRHSFVGLRDVLSRLLEVGALKPDNYASCSAWIEATPIDLRSNHPAIKEQDFLLMDEEENRAQWDFISLSLVLNFVPDVPNRGRMLRMAHSMLRPGGYVFLAVCVLCRET